MKQKGETKQKSNLNSNSINLQQKRMIVVVPVSPFEPKYVIEKSYTSLRKLENPFQELKIIYVIDTKKGKSKRNDERVKFIKEIKNDNFSVYAREDSQGKRAGAISEVINQKKGYDYLSIFDIDSRPRKNFLKENAELIEENDDCFMASGPRYLTNLNQNLITRFTGTEYSFITDMQLLYSKKDAFNHFNGLIGVLDFDYVKEKGLNQNASCEDIDLSQRAYLDGKIALISTETGVGEQAPAKISDLYNQKLRWLSGACESISNYFKKFINSKLETRKKISYSATLLVPFFGFLFSPLAFAYGARIDNKKGNYLLNSIIMFIHIWLISYIGLIAGIKHISNQNVEWKKIDREDK